MIHVLMALLGASRLLSRPSRAAIPVEPAPEVAELETLTPEIAEAKKDPAAFASYVESNQAPEPTPF